MYLKSLKITNFRKFGDKNNLVEFVGSKDLSSNSVKNNIAHSATLIIGKNNSGKTTVTEALKKLLCKNKEFKATDFNFIYLNKLLDEYRNNIYKHFPCLEFEIKVHIDFNSNNDLTTNVPFMSIGNIQSGKDEGDFQVFMKYEMREREMFANEVKSLINKYNEEYVLFRKFLELMDKDETKFKLNYYDAEGKLANDKNFNISDLIEIKPIGANKIIDDKRLSKTFNKIINFRYKNEKNLHFRESIDTQLDDINEKITKNVAKSHTESINTALGKIESNDRLQVLLSADLTFEKLMSNIIKYEYSDGTFHIPEGQFGLGYSNLMTIIGDIIDYIEQYPKQELHSKINLICIEEPEAFMHLQMQELFIKYINDAIQFLLKDKNKEINSQLIITTHSSHILNSKIHSGNSLDSISYMTIVDNLSYVINLNDENVIEEKSGNANTELVLTDTTEKDRKANDLKFLKKHIKYKVSELFFSDAVIFVEGVTEETLISYFIEHNENLNKYYISIFNINGAHALIYHKLIKLLKVPTLIITDLDIIRNAEEKEKYTQIKELKDRKTTNATISYFHADNDNISSLKSYFEDENLYIVTQKESIEGYYATSFEEAYILTNYDNKILNKVLKITKPQIYESIVGNEGKKANLKRSSFKLQIKISNCKSDFSNALLYAIVTAEQDIIPKLPKYIIDGLDWLELSIKKQIKGVNV
ncbi:MAG: AAA family ATPase [Candidatus Lokiarchaeota archaeon]|nr:AAA family ATPase [Candidatus Lokiarchaeota archaeon]